VTAPESVAPERPFPCRSVAATPRTGAYLVAVEARQAGTGNDVYSLYALAKYVSANRLHHPLNSALDPFSNSFLSVESVPSLEMVRR
jgi:hypothetical protein